MGWGGGWLGTMRWGDGLTEHVGSRQPSQCVPLVGLRAVIHDGDVIHSFEVSLYVSEGQLVGGGGV